MQSAFGHRPGSIYQAEPDELSLTSSSAPSSASTTTRNKTSAPSVVTGTQNVETASISPLDDASLNAKKRIPLQWVELSTHSVIIATSVGMCVSFFDGSLFSWHPILMTLGFVGFMGEGVLTAIAFRLKEGKDRVSSIQKHAGWQLSALLSILCAFYAIYLNKAAHDKPHFQSLHSRLGVTTLLLLIFVPMGGALAFKSLGWLQKIPEVLHPKVKQAHRTLGVITWFLALTTMLFGLSTPSIANGSVTYLLQGLVAATGILMAYQLARHSLTSGKDYHMDAACKLV